MKERIINDITVLKNMLYKSTYNDERIIIYRELSILINLYKKLYNAKDINNIYKGINSYPKPYKDTYEKAYNDYLHELVSIFLKEKHMYIKICQSLENILGDILYNNKFNIYREVSINEDILEKLLLIVDKNLYNYYTLNKSNIICKNELINNLNNFCGETYSSTILKSSYALCRDDMFTYAHELAHMYQDNIINMTRLNDFYGEIYSYSTENIMIRLSNNKNQRFKYLYDLEYFVDRLMDIFDNIYEIEITNKYIINLHDDDHINEVNYILQYFIGLYGGLILGELYLEDKSSYHKCINQINEDFDKNKSLKKFKNLSYKLKYCDNEKLVRNFVKK